MPEHTKPSPWNHLFPADVATVVAQDSDRHKPLHDAEQACVADAVEKRQREFTAGRQCLHRCLTQLGLQIHPPILMGKLREPLMPNGYVGTISHCNNYCVAAAAQASDYVGLGLDVEHNTPLEPGLSALICHPAELTHIKCDLSHLTPAEQHTYPDPGKLIFSIKESFYKAYFPQLKAYFDFLDAQVSLNLLDRTGELTLVRPVGDQSTTDEKVYETKFNWDAKYIYSAVTIKATN